MHDRGCTDVPSSYAISLRWIPLVLVLAVAGCGGGGGGGSSSSSNGGSNTASTAPSSPPPPTPPTTPPATPAFPEIGLTFTGAAITAVQPTPASGLKRVMDVGGVAYDQTRNRLLVGTILSGSYGILALRPADLAPVAFMPTTSPPVMLALSDDATQLYASLFFESAVQQFDLNSGTSVRKFQVAASGSGLGAFDIAVRPGAPNSVAVAIGSAPLIPTFSEIAFFVDGVRQPKNYKNIFGPRASEIEFLDANTLLGFDNETTAFSLSRFTVADDGVTQGSSTTGFCCFGTRLGMAGARGGFLGGMFFDPATLHGTKTIDSITGDKVYHPGTDSLVSVTNDVYSTPISTLRLIVEEYDYSRGNLKRRLRIDETLPGTDPINGVIPVVLSIVPVGASAVAVMVADDVTGTSAVLVYDLASVPLLPARTFDVQRVTQGATSALAISLPAYAYDYDPVGDRIAATLTPFVGPQGNSLAVLRASDGVVERLVPLSSEPRTVSVSPTGGMAYVSLPFENAVQAVDLDTGTLVWKTRIQFESGGTNGFDVQSIAVKPDDPQAIVLAGCESVCGNMVPLFRNGTYVGAFQGSMQDLSAVAFNGPSEVVVLDANTTGGYLTRLALSGSTLTFTSQMFAGLDGGGSVNNKVAYGLAYGPYALTDIQASRRVGRFANGSRDFLLFEQTALLSATSGVGYNRTGSITVGIPPPEYYELLTRSGVQADATLLFSGQSRIVLTDERFNNGFRGNLVAAGNRRFAHAFTSLRDGIGVLYLVTTP